MFEGQKIRPDLICFQHYPKKRVILALIFCAFINFVCDVSTEIPMILWSN